MDRLDMALQEAREAGMLTSRCDRDQIWGNLEAACSRRDVCCDHRDAEHIHDLLTRDEARVVQVVKRGLPLRWVYSLDLPCDMLDENAWSALVDSAMKKGKRHEAT